MFDSAVVEEIAARYTRFAQMEAHNRSRLYEQLSMAIAGDDALLRLIAELPKDKRQPNLLFASIRKVCGTRGDFDDYLRSLSTRFREIRAVILSHRTQTNIPARCATLLPVLALLPQPLALLEVGASAGLCLLPDRYAYCFNETVVQPFSHSRVPTPLFHCSVNSATPVPQSNVKVVWRRGLDLAPVNIRDPERVEWLESLVWPGEESKLEELQLALNIARLDPPMVERGDLRTDLSALASRAPYDATLVVFHSAVLTYVESERERIDFVETVRKIRAVWIANEGPGVLSQIVKTQVTQCMPSEFLVSVNGKPVAAADAHGKSLRWFADAECVS